MTYKVFGIDAGVASFIAYTTIHRTQILDASLEKQANMGVSQGKSDSTQVYTLDAAVPTIACNLKKRDMKQTRYIDDTNTAQFQRSMKLCEEALERWIAEFEPKLHRHNYFANRLKCVILGVDCSKSGTAITFDTKWNKVIKLTNQKGEKVPVPVLTNDAMVNPRCEYKIPRSGNSSGG